MRKHIFFLLVAALVSVACTNDAFKTGDSEYSYLRSDFVEAATDGTAAFVSAITDDGDTLSLRPPLRAKWATKPDTTYRAQLLYNKKDAEIEPVLISKVYVLAVQQQPKTEPITNDPVGFTSAWLAKTGKYINLELALKTGKINAEQQPSQSLGIVLESVEALEKGAKKYKIRLQHKQNNVPQYYTVRTFVSIPTSFFHKGDSVELHIDTYKGEVIKGFIMRNSR